ncbi:hypothetical protein HY993_02910, partial [Candidatus Micrarchaeota archaeon]|nr:hypothetical protein [Candidatus Micrarchaeota archaeon]
YDHQRVVRDAAKVFGSADAVKKAVLQHPQFAGLDYERVVRKATVAYGNEKAVKKAIMRHPQFAGLDHERALRKARLFGRLVGLDEGEVKNIILAKPQLAGLASRRHVAALAVARQLREEGIPMDERMLEVWLKYTAVSPYVPGTEKLRIPQARKLGLTEEPPLLKTMRARLKNKRE